MLALVVFLLLFVVMLALGLLWKVDAGLLRGRFGVLLK